MNSSSAREGVTSEPPAAPACPCWRRRARTSRLTKAESFLREQQHEHRAGLDAADDLRGVVAPFGETSRGAIQQDTPWRLSALADLAGQCGIFKHG